MTHRKKISKGFSMRSFSYGISCALPHLWKNEMRRISIPSTSIFGRKFTEVTVYFSDQLPFSRIHSSVYNGISLRLAPIIADFPEGIIRIVEFYLERIAVDDCDMTANVFVRIHIRVRCGGGYTFRDYITTNPLSR